MTVAASAKAPPAVEGDRRGGRATVRTVAVRIRGLTKGFGSGEQRVQALRAVDWDVYAGQLTLIVGPSGCGKTTLAVGRRRHPRQRRRRGGDLRPSH